MRALRRIEVLVPLAVSLVASLLMLVAPADELARTLPVEDAFYALQVSRQMALGGGVSVDGETLTNGFQPLWVALNAPLYLVVGGDRIVGLRLSQVLSTLLWVAFVVLVAVQARDLARRHGADGAIAAAAAAIVAGGSVSILRVFHNGLETGLALVLLAGAVLLLDRWGDWTPRRVLLAGGLLGLLAWARLDAVAFVAAFGVLAALRAWRAGRSPVAPLAACVLAAVVLSPWLAYNIALDGSPMPTSGQAQSAFVDTERNSVAALRAAGDWTLAPAVRAAMARRESALSEWLGLLGLALTAAAVVFVRRRRAAPLGDGTLALVLFVAFLAAWYTLSFGAWWFLDRYLAPLLLLAIPWQAVALEHLLRGRRASRWALGALSAVVLAANVPILVVLVDGPTWPPPAWSARASNTGSHPNLNHEWQFAWIRDHVRDECVIGAHESGTLGYFRDRVVNLDGKVNRHALRAARRRNTHEYVELMGIDVVVDIRSGVRRALGDRHAAWRHVTSGRRYHAWVRRGREGCLRSERPAQIEGAWWARGG